MLSEYTLKAQEAAEIAGKILSEGFGTAFKISSKEGVNNLVTEYDFKAEKAIIDCIKSDFPNHDFLAEESGESGNDNLSSVRWVIDPLDGTVNFAHAIPIFSVSVAAEVHGEIVAGAICHPVMNEMYLAEKGKGAFLNGEAISVSGNDNFLKSMLVTGFPYNVDENPFNCVDTFVKVVNKGIPIRRLGSAAIDLAYTAAGKFDGFWEIGLHPWDVAAGILLVREAGGKVTQYSGEEYGIFDKTMLATNGKIHDSAIKTMGLT